MQDDFEPVDQRPKDAEPDEHDEAGIEIVAQASEIEDALADAGEGLNYRKEILEWVYAILFALAITLIVKGFIFDVVKVDGRSMETTLLDNDRLILTKLGYTPKQSDIVVLDSNYKKREEYIAKKKQAVDGLSWFEEFRLRYFTPTATGLKPRYYVKRVIAKAGQTIDINRATGEVTVDGVVLNEPYIRGIQTLPHEDFKFPYTVEEGRVFVMGDNRGNSQDSRSATLGTVPNKAVIGKAAFRIWPFSHFGRIY